LVHVVQFAILILTPNFGTDFFVLEFCAGRNLNGNLMPILRTGFQRWFPAGLTSALVHWL